MTCEMLRTIQVTMTLHGGNAGGYISLWKYSVLGPPRDIPGALQTAIPVSASYLFVRSCIASV